MVERNVTDQDQICVNTIRMLAIDIVQRADSGHPGMPMGAATMAHVLWTRHLRHNPKNPQWFDRDRFVLSAGHASALLYSLLFLTGYDVTMDDLQRFRQWRSRTAGRRRLLADLHRHLMIVDWSSAPSWQATYSYGLDDPSDQRTSLTQRGS